MGIVKEIEAKTKCLKGSGEAVANAVKTGQAEVGITAVSELVPEKDLLVEAIPLDVLPTPGTTYIGATHPEPRNPAVDAFVAFMRSAEMAKVLQANGLEPV